MGGFGGGGGLFNRGGGGGGFGGGGGLFNRGGASNACSPRPVNCQPRPQNCQPRIQQPRQPMFQPQGRPPGTIANRIGTGLRNLGPPALGLATAITSMSSPPASNPEMPQGYPPPAVASTQFPPIYATNPEATGDDALPLSSTSLSALPGNPGGYTVEDEEADLRAEVERILAEAKDKRKKDKKKAQDEDEARASDSESSDDVLDDDEVKLADAGGVSTEDELEDA